MRARLTIILMFAAILSVADVSSTNAADALDIRGAWRPDTYLLKDGTKHPVTGLIFFTQKDWTVLFFVKDDTGPRRGSGEGGTYTLQGNRLVFTHLYNLSGGDAVKGIPASPLSMAVREPAGAPTEACTIDLTGDQLTIHFPSGNAMTFRRSSGF